MEKLRNKQILVIDSSESTRLELKLLLERKGATVFTVGVVEKLKTVIEGAAHSGKPIDLILVDVRLPNCFSFFVLKQINEALKGRLIPIFVMSSGFSRFAIRQMVRWNVMGYMRKPFHMYALYDFLEERLEFFAPRIQGFDEHNRIFNDNSKEKNAA